ncbi:MAG TPA: sigma-54 dependent transcriptional regulator [Deltaproteobacteria bacterium]|jgi:two-component system response regulator HydG|nr:sigma-54-dependent Fis family transcriptional regulator [Deltaproteobacteria bacterium]OQC28803.1 MAG: Transcriptional regulatory protein ZraR [Deltaproteobacteria bacterium ADurb.Bin072]HRW80993.1 sigma-54 dependent transcriptional regulator [Desulfomonilia bacterium]NMD39222.1 sigma-54-dependent Fis family transcriptional regulator [Deltaproteobacteria bacterium]HNQ86062.1 sigma-54 dependent transcriptional regulator [Deltaproteobacteria bacterium]
MERRPAKSILVVDDDLGHRTMLRTLLGGWGYAVREADDGQGAIEAVQEGPFDLVLMDIRMVKVSGLQALNAIKEINPAIPVIIMTAYSSVETAIDAMKKGAYEYLTKPLDFDELRLKMEQAMDHSMLREENRRLRELVGDRFDSGSIIGRSPAMVRLLETTARAANSDATVLITGESGTGKEMIAGAIHFNSPRRDRSFIKMNCAAISEGLLESELFGHEKGSFTGALRRREGSFKQADSGTLFLDEVSEMSLAMQVKLLRVLQEKEFTRVGGEEVIRVDVRIIAATNKDLPALVREGGFREDLYYRLNVINLSVPPLRERREDIPLLAGHFLKMFSEKNGKPVKGYTPQAMDKLIRHPWPGNVREMMNTIESAVVLSSSTYLREGDIPDFREELATAVPPEAPDDLSLDEMERSTILKTLESVRGNKSEAARKLGITRATLHKKLKKYGVS